MEPTVLSVCSLNQWAMDFSGNLARILESIRLAKLEHNAKVRVGPELEIAGISCGEHFLEPDTIYHSWESLESILKLTKSAPYDDMLCVIGMPVNYRRELYNTAVFIFAGKILLIRPRVVQTDGVVFKASRYFAAWKETQDVVQYSLPGNIREITQQETVPFGSAMIRTKEGLLIGAESSEELWNPIASSTHLFLQGAHVVLNLSSSVFQLEKLNKLGEMIASVTRKAGGVYLYANYRGCDGSRELYDGASLIAMNGKFLKVSNQFSLNDVEVISGIVDISEVDGYRSPVPSRNRQADALVAKNIAIIDSPDYSLCYHSLLQITKPLLHFPVLYIQEQIGYAISCYMWDYLRRSGAKGFVLPMSGNEDSIACLALLGLMCRLVMNGLNSADEYNRAVLAKDTERLIGKIPESHTQLAYDLIYTILFSSEDSPTELEDLSHKLAQEIGCSFHMQDLSGLYSAFSNMFQEITGKEPHKCCDGGSRIENIAIRNVHARGRVAYSYFLAQLLQWVNGKYGVRLVVGSANLEDSIAGTVIKYDISSADINPIGGISKSHLEAFLTWASRYFTCLANLPQTSELCLVRSQSLDRPPAENIYTDELISMGKMRQQHNCGPLSMFRRLCSEWSLPPHLIAEKVKTFFILYGKNKHKISSMTPSINTQQLVDIDSVRPDRLILYNISWKAQFDAIDRDLQDIEKL